MTADANAIAKLSGTYTLAVTDAAVVNASSLQSNAKVSSIAIEDTANNIANAFTSLDGMNKVTSMTANDNDSVELTMTANQLSQTYAASLAKLTTSYTVAVTDATAANASSISDGAAALGAVVAELEHAAITKIGQQR